MFLNYLNVNSVDKYFDYFYVKGMFLNVSEY